MTPNLNLGCGSRFHPEWVNVDFRASGPGVIAHDLRTGLPFAAGTFSAVYHSHVLEHFTKDAALPFMRECFRVLKSGGVIRIVVPDLEQLAVLYLEALAKAAAGDPEWKRNYEWLMLELYDQAVRQQTGGDMLTYVRRDEPKTAFILERMGVEGRQNMASAAGTSGGEKAVHLPFPLRHLRSVYRLIRYPARRHEWFARRLLGAEYEDLQLGRFRRSGEIHQWMYDRYSLACLLRQAGFPGAEARGPADSRIPHWADYCLDTEPDGTIYKPGSLFMEAVKP